MMRSETAGFPDPGIARGAASAAALHTTARLTRAPFPEGAQSMAFAAQAAPAGTGALLAGSRRVVARAEGGGC